ncbi:MICOS complex subunit MIC10 [Mactra antiquata]
MAENSVRSEDVLGQKWDRCLADTSIKTVTGAAVGIVFSVLFFKKRPWPVTLLAGIGFGMGYSNCQHDFQTPYIKHGKLVKDTDDSSGS